MEVWKLKKKRINTALRHHFFSDLVINWWNKLDDDVVCAKTYHSHPISHVSSSSPASLLSPSITPSHFHSRLKTHLFHKSFPP